MAGDADKEAFQRLDEKVEKIGESVIRLDATVGNLVKSTQRLDEKVEKIGESVIRLDTTVGNLAKSTDFLNETVKELLPLKGSITFHSSVVLVLLVFVLSGGVFSGLKFSDLTGQIGQLTAKEQNADERFDTLDANIAQLGNEIRDIGDRLKSEEASRLKFAQFNFLAEFGLDQLANVPGIQFDYPVPKDIDDVSSIFSVTALLGRGTPDDIRTLVLRCEARIVGKMCRIHLVTSGEKQVIALRGFLINDDVKVDIIIKTLS